jgi:hypothetical protein
MHRIAETQGENAAANPSARGRHARLGYAVAVDTINCEHYVVPGWTNPPMVPLRLRLQPAMRIGPVTSQAAPMRPPPPLQQAL